MENFFDLLAALCISNNRDLAFLVEQELEAFVLAQGDTSGQVSRRSGSRIVFPAMGGTHRWLIHQVAERFGLTSSSAGYGFDRATAVQLPCDGASASIPTLSLRHFISRSCTLQCWSAVADEECNEAAPETVTVSCVQPEAATSKTRLHCDSLRELADVPVARRAVTEKQDSASQGPKRLRTANNEVAPIGDEGKAVQATSGKAHPQSRGPMQLYRPPGSRSPEAPSILAPASPADACPADKQADQRPAVRGRGGVQFHSRSQISASAADEEEQLAATVVGDIGADIKGGSSRILNREHGDMDREDEDEDDGHGVGPSRPTVQQNYDRWLGETCREEMERWEAQYGRLKAYVELKPSGRSEGSWQRVTKSHTSHRSWRLFEAGNGGVKFTAPLQQLGEPEGSLSVAFTCHHTEQRAGRRPEDSRGKPIHESSADDAYQIHLNWETATAYLRHCSARRRSPVWEVQAALPAAQAPIGLGARVQAWWAVVRHGTLAFGRGERVGQDIVITGRAPGAPLPITNFSFCVSGGERAASDCTIRGIYAVPPLCRQLASCEHILLLTGWPTLMAKGAQGEADAALREQCLQRALMSAAGALSISSGKHRQDNMLQDGKVLMDSCPAVKIVNETQAWVIFPDLAQARSMMMSQRTLQLQLSPLAGELAESILKSAGVAPVVERSKASHVVASRMIANALR
ncbi:hypothetical protein CYMTET_45507 [Cymbomonas tetramitiformis]|uniref:R3H domain-containing protein n=1 Tax=Cymbomonas tetramitiformis TaxID=36881 RepID=A0AAE0BZW8_9CHLO|nr:hypothetical protein CYMTET_45507 [Cymbomonas tetramitiformis]